MTKKTMFAVALALTFHGLTGCETASVSNMFGDNNLNFGVGSASSKKLDGGYPLGGGDLLVTTQVRF